MRIEITLLNDDKISVSSIVWESRNDLVIRAYDSQVKRNTYIFRQKDEEKNDVLCLRSSPNSLFFIPLSFIKRIEEDW
jgi:hypothetical protein